MQLDLNAFMDYSELKLHTLSLGSGLIDLGEKVLETFVSLLRAVCANKRVTFYCGALKQFIHVCLCICMLMLLEN